MWPVLFDWHGTIIYSYPLFTGLSWGIGYRLAEHKLPQDLNRNWFNLWVVGLFLASWMGAKTLFLFTQNRWPAEDLVRASNFWLGGGFVFLGGFISACLYTWFTGLLHADLKPERMRFVLVPLLWGHAVGRVGCFLAGCCFGSETNVPWSVHMHGSSRHPTQLYEAFGLAVLAWILQKRARSAYQIGWYLLGYGILRWTVELYRGDELRGMWGWQSTSQWISLLLIVAGIYLCFRVQLAEKR